MPLQLPDAGVLRCLWFIRGPLLVLIYFLSCGSPLIAQNQTNALRIKYVDFNSESPKSVSPETFDSAFSMNQYKSWEITNESDLDSVELYFSGFQRVKNQDTDIRAKLVCNINRHNLLLYLDKYGFFTDGYYYFRNNSLFFFLKSKLENKLH